MTKKISPAQIQELVETLHTRFDANIDRHPGIKRADIESKLTKSDKLGSLHAMETTGGKPDVIGYDSKTKEYLFCDCSPESPSARRSLCYDAAALASRKEHKPADSACAMAQAMGVELLTEEQYRHLQTLGEFDTKTSSWIQTPPSIRKLGGSLFADRRYDTVFVYHNGAESYYAARGWRGIVKV